MNAPVSELDRKQAALRELIRGFGRVVVAFSGGVDSSLVARIAAEELGADALAVTSGSASLKRSDLALASELAERWQMRHRVIVTDEVSKPEYRANPVNRCFHCKTTLYDALARIARDEEPGAVIVNGTNTDDLGDHRPGLIAAADEGRGRVEPARRGAFKTPTLRDAARRASFFHDGSAATLADAVRWHLDGGVGQGAARAVIDPALTPAALSDEEVAQLLAFLTALRGAEAP